MVGPFPWKPGSGKCPFALGGGQLPPSWRAGSSSASWSLLSSCFIAIAQFSKSRRCVNALHDTRWPWNANFPTQYWRLITTFLYFGPFSIDLLFHIYFLQRYSRLLEESSGRSPAHFSWLLLFSMASLLLLSPFVQMPFLGHPLSSTLVYIWSRRNPDTLMSFLGLLTFRAPYLPWVLMGISFVIHGTVPKDELMGVLIGHIWYFFNDVYPPLHGGSRPLDPPRWWCRLFGEFLCLDRASQ